MKKFLSILLQAFLCVGLIALVAGAETIAVLDFKSLLADEDLGVAVAEILKTELAGLGEYTIIERGMLEQILEEQALQLSGAVDTDTAVKIGQLVGANVVVTGSIVKTGEMYTINSRFIEVETGIVKVGQNIRGQGDDQISNMVRQLALIITGKAVVTEEAKQEPQDAPQAQDEPEKPEREEREKGENDRRPGEDAPPPRRLPRELVEACLEKEEGAKCQVTGPRGKGFEASCHSIEGQLACLMGRDDAPEKLRQQWDKLDRNHDGFLDLHEILGDPPRQGKRPPKGKRPPAGN